MSAFLRQHLKIFATVLGIATLLTLTMTNVHRHDHSDASRVETSCTVCKIATQSEHYLKNSEKFPYPTRMVTQGLPTHPKICFSLSLFHTLPIRAPPLSS